MIGCNEWNYSLAWNYSIRENKEHWRIFLKALLIKLMNASLKAYVLIDIVQHKRLDFAVRIFVWQMQSERYEKISLNSLIVTVAKSHKSSPWKAKKNKKPRCSDNLHEIFNDI